MDTLFDLACSPDQYDSPDFNWEKEGTLESPRTFFIYEYLKKYLPDWKGKKVLDIGSGTGWLLSEAKKAGAAQVTGIEPSSSNHKLSNKLNPSIKVFDGFFQNFSGGQKFDIVCAILSLSHMRDACEAFAKIRSLLNPEGQVYIVVPDYEYFKSQRHSYPIRVEQVNNGEYAVAVTREWGSIADIVRRNDVYVKAAGESGLTVLEQVAMKPTAAYIEKALKYADYKNVPIFQLLIFGINDNCGMV